MDYRQLNKEGLNHAFSLFAFQQDIKLKKQDRGWKSILFDFLNSRSKKQHENIQNNNFQRNIPATPPQHNIPAASEDVYNCFLDLSRKIAQQNQKTQKTDKPVFTDENKKLFYTKRAGGRQRQRSGLLTGLSPLDQGSNNHETPQIPQRNVSPLDQGSNLNPPDKGGRGVKKIAKQRGQFLFGTQGYFKAYADFCEIYRQTAQRGGKLMAQIKGIKGEKQEAMQTDFWGMIFCEGKGKEKQLWLIPKENRQGAKSFLEQTPKEQNAEDPSCLYIFKSLTMRALHKLCFAEQSSFVGEMPQELKKLQKYTQQINTNGDPEKLKHKDQNQMEYLKAVLKSDYAKQKLDLKDFNLDLAFKAGDLKEFETELERACYCVKKIKLNEGEKIKFLKSFDVTVLQLDSYDLKGRHQNTYQTPASPARLHTSWWKDFWSEVSGSFSEYGKKAVPAHSSSLSSGGRNPDLKKGMPAFVSPLAGFKKSGEEQAAEKTDSEGSPFGKMRLNPEVKIRFRQEDKDFKKYFEKKFPEKFKHRRLRDQFTACFTMALHSEGRHEELAFAKLEELSEKIDQFNQEFNEQRDFKTAWKYGIDRGNKELATLCLVKFNPDKTYTTDEDSSIKQGKQKHSGGEDRQKNREEDRKKGKKKDIKEEGEKNRKADQGPGGGIAPGKNTGTRAFPLPEFPSFNGKVECLVLKDCSYFEERQESKSEPGKTKKRYAVHNLSYFMKKEHLSDKNLFEQKSPACLDLTTAKVIKGHIVENGDVMTHIKLKKAVAKRKLFELYGRGEISNTEKLEWSDYINGNPDEKSHDGVLNIKSSPSKGKGTEQTIYKYCKKYEGIPVKRGDGAVDKYNKDSIKNSLQFYLDSLRKKDESHTPSVLQINHLRDALTANMIGVICFLQKTHPGFVILEDLKKYTVDRHFFQSEENIARRLENALYSKFQSLGLVPPHVKDIIRLREDIRQRQSFEKQQDKQKSKEKAKSGKSHQKEESFLKSKPLPQNGLKIENKQMEQGNMEQTIKPPQIGAIVFVDEHSTSKTCPYCGKNKATSNKNRKKTKTFSTSHSKSIKNVLSDKGNNKNKSLKEENMKFDLKDIKYRQGRFVCAHCGFDTYFFKPKGEWADKPYPLVDLSNIENFKKKLKQKNLEQLMCLDDNDKIASYNIAKKITDPKQIGKLKL